MFYSLRKVQSIFASFSSLGEETPVEREKREHWDSTITSRGALNRPDSLFPVSWHCARSLASLPPCQLYSKFIFNLARSWTGIINLVFTDAPPVLACGFFPPTMHFFARQMPMCFLFSGTTPLNRWHFLRVSTTSFGHSLLRHVRKPCRSFSKSKVWKEDPGFGKKMVNYIYPWIQRWYSAGVVT